MLIWTPMSSVLKKADKLNLSLSTSGQMCQVFIEIGQQCLVHKVLCHNCDNIYDLVILYQNVYAKLYIQGAISIRKTVLPGMAIPMLKIRRPNGRLIFNMEIAILR